MKQLLLAALVLLIAGFLTACGGADSSSTATIAAAPRAKILAVSPTTSDAAVTARYVRLQALSEVNGNPWTSVAEFNVLDASGAVIPRAGWSVVADSQELVGEYAPATNAIDGDPSTYWHTQWQGTTPPLPHTLTIDLGAARGIAGFRYLPRQGGINGRIANWQFSTSTDGSNWTLASQGRFAGDAAEATVMLPVASAGSGASATTGTPSLGARYVRLEATSEINGNPWTSMAEFNVLDSTGAVIPRNGWSVTADSQELVGEYAPATNVLDGDVNTFWHSQWLAVQAPLPHALTVSLGAAHDVAGFKYLPRQIGLNGRIAGWNFYTSTDNTTWTRVAQGVFVDSASEQSYFASAAPAAPAQPPTSTAPTTTTASRRAARIAAFASGPLVPGTPWRASESVTVDTVRQIGAGQHLVYTAAGTTGTTIPVLGGTVVDGRPIADGSATAYVNGRVAAATAAGAPTLSPAVDAIAAGLALTSFAVGNFQAPAYATVQGCKSISTGTSFIGHYCFANGLAAGSGNATSVAAGPYGAGLSNQYVYHANNWEEEFVVTDTRFGLVFANSVSPIDVEVDGVQVLAGPTISSGSEGWTLIFDYHGVVKARTLRVVSSTGSVAPTLRGVALSPQGSVAAGTTSTDQVLILGDSINATVTPTSEAGAQIMSYWLEHDLGFGGAINMAVGGSGYVSQNTNTFNIPTLLANPVNQALIASYAPNIGQVIIGAGFNDRTRPIATVQAAALASWKTLRGLLPNAKITITDGWSGSSGPDANALALAAALATTFAAWGDGNARLIHSIGTSTATAYISGTGNAGLPPTSGNSSVYTSTDGTHPSPAGARYLAQRLASDITSAWAGAY